MEVASLLKILTSCNKDAKLEIITTCSHSVRLEWTYSGGLVERANIEVHQLELKNRVFHRKRFTAKIVMQIRTALRKMKVNHPEFNFKTLRQNGYLTFINDSH